MDLRINQELKIKLNSTDLHIMNAEILNVMKLITTPGDRKSEEFEKRIPYLKRIQDKINELFEIQGNIL